MDKSEPKKMGRPRKEIKKDTFEKLCAMMCTEEELCGFFGISDKTLNRWCRETYGGTFSEIYKNLTADGKISLRRYQFRLAERSTAMAIFLGKQYLGQRDKFEYVDTTANEKLEAILDGIRHNAESEAK